MLGKIKSLRHNRQVVNSFSLLFASVAVAGFGFIFWTVVARSFADATVGIAATLLSLSSLISLLSLAGFDTTFVRFLPKSDRGQDYINSGLAISAILSSLLSVVFLVVLAFVSPDFSFLITNPLYIGLFIFFNVISTLNVLTNSVFLAYRKAVYILIINVLFSLVKVALPFIISDGDPMTIFVLAGLAQLVGLLLSVVFIIREFSHTFRLKIHLDVLKLAQKYSFAVYGSSVLNLIPPTVLPLIITSQLNPESSAYYYMTFTIASVLYTVAYSAMQSAFAEGSHEEHLLKSHIKKAAQLIIVLMLPAALLLYLLTPWLLSIFGQQYAQQGSTLLQLFCVASLFVSSYSALGSVLKIKGEIKALVSMNITYAVVIIGASYIGIIYGYGLVAVGIAWLLGNVAASLVGAVLYITGKRRQDFRRSV